MKRFLLVVVAILGAGGGSACNKPTVEDCRLAVTNVRKLYDTDNIAKNGDDESEVRRCKGGSTRESVACAIKAQSIEALKACGFMAHKSPK